MNYIIYTIPKATFEYIFEQIKQFYDVTSWLDYGIIGKFIDGKYNLPDKVTLLTYNPNFLSIFDDKHIRNFLHRSGITDSDLNVIQCILTGVCTVYIKRINTPDMSDEEFYYNDTEEYFKYKLETELRELHKFCHIVTNNGYSSK